jgi:hypothetical protein
MEITFQMKYSTKGAIRYTECDHMTGVPLEVERGIHPDAKIGTLYLRKSSFPDGMYPTRINVVITQTMTGTPLSNMRRKRESKK